MINFLHSGGLGDIVYSIPTIQALGGGVVYIKASNYSDPYGNQYDLIKDLLLLQPGIKQVRPYYPPGDDWRVFIYNPAIHIDYDLDRFRLEKNKRVTPIIKRHMDAFNIKKNYKRPWLIVDDIDKKQEEFSLIHLTPRWREQKLVDWKKVLSNIAGKVYFVGFGFEHLDFCLKYGQIEHIPTTNILQLARLVRDCKALYCNQSVTLTLAQGLGKDYYLEVNPGRKQCLFGTKNEHLL